jgi:penicillin-binding protein 1A
VPALDAVTDYRPKIPLRIYTADNVLIGEFGEEHRDFVPIKKIPDLMKKSLLAIEDARFYEHGAIDFQRARRRRARTCAAASAPAAARPSRCRWRVTSSCRAKSSSAANSTKIALAYKIEAALSKDEILELYMNQIYLGQRAYGFSSAARTYFNKNLDQLSVAEMAMLAGLPQNPSRHNPVVNPKRARERQHAVLKRMRELDYISEDQYQKALHEPLRVNTRGQEFDTHAEYVAELARQAVFASSRKRPTPRASRSHHDPEGRAGSGLQLGAPQRAGLRPAPRLPRPGRPHRTAGRRGRARRRHRRSAGQAPVSDGLIPAVVLEAPQGGQGRDHRRRRRHHQRRRPEVRPARWHRTPRKTAASAPGAVVRVARTAKAPGASPRCRRWRRPSSRSTTPAPITRWSAASTTTCRSSTT